MAIPPAWTRELLSGSLEEVAAKLKGNETIRDLQSKATQLLGDLPATAARSLDRMLRETRKGSEQVRRWARRYSSLSMSAINGSGTWLHDSLAGIPLSAGQVDALLPEDDLAPLNATAVGPRIEQRLQSALTKHLDTSCLVAHSFSAAIVAVGASLQRDATLAIPRSAIFRVDGSRPLPELLSATGNRVVEYGSLDGCSAADLLAAIRPFSGLANSRLVTVQVALPQVPQVEIPSEPANESLLISPYACPRDLPEIAALGVPRLTSADVQRHWLTVIPGNGFVGGPNCGVLLGSPAALECVRSAPLWSVLQAGQGTLAALALTLEGYNEAQQEPASLESLLTTSEENLQNRSQRLATQLAGEPSVAHCEILSEFACLAPHLPSNVPSRQLRIRFHGGNAAERQIRLLSDSPALLTRAQEDCLILDLRWIPPQFDNQLVSLLIGRSPETVGG